MLIIRLAPAHRVQAGSKWTGAQGGTRAGPSAQCKVLGCVSHTTHLYDAHGGEGVDVGLRRCDVIHVIRHGDQHLGSGERLMKSAQQAAQSATCMLRPCRTASKHCRCGGRTAGPGFWRRKQPSSNNACARGRCRVPAPFPRPRHTAATCRCPRSRARARPRPADPREGGSRPHRSPRPHPHLQRRPSVRRAHHSSGFFGIVLQNPLCTVSPRADISHRCMQVADMRSVLQEQQGPHHRGPPRLRAPAPV